MFSGKIRPMRSNSVRMIFIAAFLLVASVVATGCSGSKEPTPTVAAVPTVAPTATPIPREIVAITSVTKGSGEFRLTGTDTWAALKAGDGLAVGDRVRSAEGSVVAVTFKDGSVLILEQSSEVEVQSFTMTMVGERVTTRVGRVATIKGTVSGDVRDDLIYPPSVFEIVTSGEIITIKGKLTG